jgi:deazaflavin-dependent oxidoreductase (nitroreductase family)
MVKQVLGVVGALVALALAAVAALVATLRFKWQPGLRFVTRMNRRFVRDRAITLAGRPGDAHVVVHHVGRTSGRSYSTPIGVERTPAGLIVTLPYGPGTDWVRNLLAADGGELTIDGETVRITSPRLIAAAQAAPLISAGERRVARIFGVTEYLLLQVDDAA